MSPGYDNQLADCLSRFQFVRARVLAQDWDDGSTVIPAQLQPETERRRLWGNFMDERGSWSQIPYAFDMESLKFQLDFKHCY